MDRQASENAREGTTRGIFLGIALVALVGIGFGGVQVFQFFSNFETNQYKRNISITLKEPKVVGGQAQVSVDIKNHNAVDISNPVVDYSIQGSDGKPIATGQVKIDGTVPAADKRSFEQVMLGEVNGQPARMKSDLVTLTVVGNDKLPTGYAARFAGAMERAGSERIEALTPLADEVPGFAGGYIAIGLTYRELEDWPRALEQFKKAVEANAGSANAHYHYGMALAHEKKTAEAVAELKKAHELSPSDLAISKAVTSFGNPKPAAAGTTGSDSDQSL